MFFPCEQFASVYEAISQLPYHSRKHPPITKKDAVFGPRLIIFIPACLSYLIQAFLQRRRGNMAAHKVEKLKEFAS